MSAMLRYRSKYGLSDSNGNDFLDIYDDLIDAYTLFDFSISHQIERNHSIQIGINNMFGYTNPENISNISGRIYYVKLNMNLNIN